MSRRELNESQLTHLERWALTIDPEKGELVRAALFELRALRDRESATRMLMEIEGEV